MAARILYDWKAAQRVNDFKLEGRGELLEDDGALLIRTFHCGPMKRATTVWMPKLILPPAFEVEWDYRTQSADGNTMIIFNALPLSLNDLFDDSRPDARYCDIASNGKMICHSIGFHRAPFGRPSVLRKLGGHVPASWGQMVWPAPADFEEKTSLSSVSEPLNPADKGKVHTFRLVRRERTIEFYVNKTKVHDWQEAGQYEYYKEPISGGRLAFRNFGGFADDYYSSIVIREL
jgi:hypothetical protein